MQAPFIGAFGASEFEVWLGKDGLRRHTAAELGRVLAESLAPLVEDARVVALVSTLHRAGRFGAEPVDPGPP